MKTKVGFTLLLIALTLALFVAGCNRTFTPTRALSAVALSTQVLTPTPPAEDQSEIGSTDGIFIMGIIIVVITSLPILLHKRK